MLREAPSLEWGLVPTLLSLSGIRIQPFWGLENVQTPFLLGLCCPEYQAGPFQWAELCQPCTESSAVGQLPLPSPLVPACFLARTDQAPAVGKQPGPLSPCLRGGRRAQGPSILAGTCGPGPPPLALPQPV